MAHRGALDLGSAGHSKSRSGQVRAVDPNVS